MESKCADEYILTFPSSLLRDVGYFQGLNFDVDKYLKAIDEKYKYLRRADVEKDTNYKQLIPYVILNHDKRIFSYRRGALLSEKRLLHNRSIGIGGHISADDPNLFTLTYDEGMRREVREEIYIDTDYDSNVVALLNDDSNEVGRVHFGVIHVLSLLEPKVRKREKSINKPEFLSFDDLKRNIEQYENWSQICIESIDKLLQIM